MNLLLDTKALLWMLQDDERLGPKARQSIENAHSISISEVSLWEISIKISIGKMQPIPELLGTIRDLGFRRLSLSDDHLRKYEALPLHHRDPFDCMLLAQASIEGLAFVTSDTFLEKYGIHVISTTS